MRHPKRATASFLFKSVAHVLCSNIYLVRGCKWLETLWEMITLQKSKNGVKIGDTLVKFASQTHWNLMKCYEMCIDLSTFCLPSCVRCWKVQRWLRTIFCGFFRDICGWNSSVMPMVGSLETSNLPSLMAVHGSSVCFGGCFGMAFGGVTSNGHKWSPKNHCNLCFAHLTIDRSMIQELHRIT
jgi:hypothetical protein